MFFIGSNMVNGHTKSLGMVLSIMALLIYSPYSLAAEPLAQAVAALEKKKYRDTVRLAGKTLATAKQKPEVMAKALLTRGIAYRNQGKIAQAIADFSNAEWLRKLNKDDLRRLYSERALAYEAVGQKALAAKDRKIASSSSLKGSLSQHNKLRKTSIKPNNSPLTSPQSTGDFFSGLGNLFGFGTNAPKQKPIETAKVESPPIKTKVQSDTSKKQVVGLKKIHEVKQSSAWKAKRVETLPKKTSVKAPTQIAPKEQKVDSAGNGVANFFNSIFGGGQKPIENTKEQDVISADQVAALADEDQKSRREFKKSAKVKEKPPIKKTRSKEKKPVKVAVARQQKKKAAKSQTPTKRSLYHLQLGAFGEVSAADKFADRLTKNYKSIVGNKVAMVVETDVGNSRTQYRVYLGPYRDKAKGLSSCKAFKRLGLGCSLLE